MCTYLQQPCSLAQQKIPDIEKPLQAIAGNGADPATKLILRQTCDEPAMNQFRKKNSISGKQAL
jgi:hypothetical protein